MRGAVSPTMRAMPSSTAVTMPERAVGSTTDHTVRHWGAPRASEASRSPLGHDPQHLFGGPGDGGRRMTIRARDAANPE